MINLCHKIRIFPSREQEIVLRKACGTSRYTYNWALARYKKMKAEGVEKVSMRDLKKIWNQEKPDWVYDAPKDANQQPFDFLRLALNNFYEKRAKYPKFKKKHKSHDSFYISNDKARFEGKVIKLPLMGEIEMAEPFRFQNELVKVSYYTVTRTADKWFVCITAHVNKSHELPSFRMTGIDVGLSSFCTNDEGEKIFSPMPLRKNVKKLKRLSRRFSNSKKKSKKRKKKRFQLAKFHARVANIRKDFIHKTTHKIAKENCFVAIENLDVVSIFKSRLFNRAVQDVGWGMFKEQLSHKVARRGGILVKVDKYFPSTQTCSHCGHVHRNEQKLTLSDREMVCKSCGTALDRDQNAATNILAHALKITYPEATGKLTPVEIVVRFKDFLQSKAKDVAPQGVKELMDMTAIAVMSSESNQTQV